MEIFSGWAIFCVLIHRSHKHNPIDRQIWTFKNAAIRWNSRNSNLFNGDHIENFFYVIELWLLQNHTFSARLFTIVFFVCVRILSSCLPSIHSSCSSCFTLSASFILTFALCFRFLSQSILLHFTVYIKWKSLLVVVQIKILIIHYFGYLRGRNKETVLVRKRVDEGEKWWGAKTIFESKPLWL